MWAVLASAIDLVHALAMVAWVVGLPLLFVRRWPRLRLGFAVYAIVFVVISQVSMLFLGECFLTTLARWAWERAPAGVASREWFTVRLAYVVFGMAPSHRTVSRASEALIVVTAAGVVYSLVHARAHARARRAAARVA